jgi:hypothetical protein
MALRASSKRLVAFGVFRVRSRWDGVRIRARCRSGISFSELFSDDVHVGPVELSANVKQKMVRFMGMGTKFGFDGDADSVLLNIQVLFASRTDCGLSRDSLVLIEFVARSGRNSGGVFGCDSEGRFSRWGPM